MHITASAMPTTIATGRPVDTSANIGPDALCEPPRAQLREQLNERHHEQTIEDQRTVEPKRLRRVIEHEGIDEPRTGHADHVRAKTQQQRAPRVAHHLGDRQRRHSPLGFERLEFRRFVDARADQQADHQQHRACEKRQTPAPTEKRVLIHRRHRAKREQRQDQARGTAQLRERGEESTPSLRRMFACHQHRAAPLATDRDALRNPQQHQQNRRPYAGARIGRQKADTDRADAHNRQRSHKRLLAADAVAEVAEYEPAERPRKKAHRERAE
ncbi:hypothetical protein KCU90_g3808, partial [Aureobasidium melanogenum]